MKYQFYGGHEGRKQAADRMRDGHDTWPDGVSPDLPLDYASPLRSTFSSVGVRGRLHTYQAAGLGSNYDVVKYSRCSGHTNRLKSGFSVVYHGKLLD